MASISGRGTKGHHTYTLTLTETGTSVANNTSTVSYSFDLTDDANWFWEGWNSITYSASANGSTLASGSIPNHTVKSQNIAKGSFTVTHNADGTKSIPFSFSVTDGANQYYTSGNASASGSMVLTTIPRATTPTFSAKNVTMGNSITITMTPASSTFKHKLRFSWSTLTNSVDGISIGANFTAQGTTTATFTPPVSLANYIPNNTSGTGAIQCYTYDANGNHIGTVDTKITLAVPSYTPSCTINFTGNNLLSSTYVQGKSTMGVTIVASSSYGASITSYSSAVDGKTYSGNSFTTSALSNGSKSVVTTITDSRGKTASVTSSTVTVYEYAAPKITSFTLARQSDNTTVIATVKGSVSSVNSKNAKTIKVTLNGVTNTITSNSYTINGTTTFTNVPTDSTLVGTAAITDSFTTVKQDSVLPTVAVTMDFYKDGKGVAFGKVAETSDMLDVAWSERVQKNLTVNGTTTLNKVVTIIEADSAPLTIKRDHESSPATIKFQNSDGNLGYIGMNGPTANGGLKRWTADGATSYTVLDAGNTKDYVIETGTSNSWNYIKWNSGRMELYADKSLSFPAGSQQTTYLWRSIVSFDLSALLTTILSGTCSVQVNGMIPQVCRHSTTKTTAEIVIVTSRTFDAFTVTAPIYIIGKWK